MLTPRSIIKTGKPGEPCKKHGCKTEKVIIKTSLFVFVENDCPECIKEQNEKIRLLIDRMKLTA